jgi:superfamily II DNA/RNA helicase
MSSTSGRPRAGGHQRRKTGAGPAAAGAYGTSRRARPPRGTLPAHGTPASRLPRRPSDDHRAAAASAASLDLALQAALGAPQPEATTFSELGVPAALVAELAAHGITEPFAIQARALPDALAGRDVLGRAQTGSGKTLAFGLPMLGRLAATPGHRRDKAPRGLVLVPTRELALQVAEVLEPLGRSLRISVMTVYGGVALGRQIERLRRGVDIVVATPGRLIDLMDRGACTLDGVSVTVVDEADHMADLGFLPSVTRILDATPAGQRLLFSATLDRGVAGLVTRYLSDPAVHAVAPIATANDVEHQVFVLPAGDKLAIAAEIAGRQGRTLFFVRTKHGADRLARQLTKAGIGAAAIHGNLNQNQRQRALAAFTAGSPRVLVATDVAARGIHVDDIGLVVHYDPPTDHKDYLHRSGRTARAGATGAVVALVEPGQVRDVGRMHDAAGVTSVSHRVEPGHEAVRELAESGSPIMSVAPPVASTSRMGGSTGRPGGSAGRPGRSSGWSGGSGRPAASARPRPRSGPAGSSRRDRPRRAAG